MKTHTQTATVREMRTLANTCQKHAADAAEHLKVCQRLSEVTCDNAVRADQAADRAEDSATIAGTAAKLTQKAKRDILITLLANTAINIIILIILFNR